MNLRMRQTAPGKRNTYQSLLSIVLMTGVLALLPVMEGCKKTPAPATPSSETPVTQAPAKPPAVPFTKKHLYDEQVDPHKEVATAFQTAKREHKRVLLDFGGDWCGDCQVLDIFFHQAPNDALLAKNFVVAHVYIGHIDQNLDIPEKYGVGIKKGVPALAVVEASGKTVYAQNGEFEDMRHMDSGAVTAFLERWKP